MRRPLAACLAAVLLTTACGGGGERTVTVFAASSLTGVFGALEQRFEADHPGVDVRLNLAGSTRLAQQIREGAPADVFASANAATMADVADAGLVDGEPATFATNELTIAVAPGNPRGISSFADLADRGLTLVTCAPQVPCGAATREVERATGVDLRPDSEEPNVRAVLTKVETGEADAGVVYVTDVRSAGQRVTGVPFAEAREAVNDYPIAVLRNAADTSLARRFRDLVLGAAGQRELAEAGFGAP
ncbi:molybdate transport system substrate-binding protein [Prauserella shujinwangii]|uniref:Molybdate transport system substrate-binding protein n=1 Tax=Prauserella shujinwangii TaxID=1453103 RepID=A0A2T0M0X5_9PSEU|nr:molybdate ABC transporter substrate-binding protein [Prauserella shujinwangii]PRX50253.1 molybdate transport system substrate-binding protein [Prauserella shujinwangii]